MRAEADGGSPVDTDAAAVSAAPPVPQLTPAEAKQKLAELDKLLASEGPQVEAQAASLAITLHQQGGLRAFGAAAQVRAAALGLVAAGPCCRGGCAATCRTASCAACSGGLH